MISLNDLSLSPKFRFEIWSNIGQLKAVGFASCPHGRQTFGARSGREKHLSLSQVSCGEVFWRMASEAAVQINFKSFSLRFRKSDLQPNFSTTEKRRSGRAQAIQMAPKRPRLGQSIKMNLFGI